MQLLDMGPGRPKNQSGRHREEKILSLLGLELRPLDHTARSQSLHRLYIELFGKDMAVINHIQKRDFGLHLMENPLISKAI
jgi:hypothetical protein